MTSEQYPSYYTVGPPFNPVTGATVAYTYDSMGRLYSLAENGSNNIISSATYGAAGNLTSLYGVWGSETRSYNAMLQLTSLSSSGVSVTYNYSATQNNGEIISQQGPVSGETITYAYGSLNRLASATSSGATPLWGQSYAYDGFGNLTDITTTQGSTPEWHQSYSAATNRAGTDVADANGNIGSGCQSSGCYNYDVENRIISSAPLTTVQYAYAPDNKRVWRSDWSNGSRTVDEVSFWSVTGQRVATFNLVTYQASLRPVQTATEYYFGGKLVKNGTGYVYSDRLGSIGKFYPYGQERPSATANGTEKFATYFRDAETGLDYATNRYHAPGQGRFLTPDPYQASGGPNDPGSWNRYAYAGGDPANFKDPAGTNRCAISGFGDDPCGGSGGDDSISDDWASDCAAGEVPVIQSLIYGGSVGSGPGQPDYSCAPATKQVTSTIPCADTIAPFDYGYTNAVLFILDENSYQNRATYSMAGLYIEDLWLASLLYNRAQDQADFAAGGTTLNSQACAAPGGTPNSTDNNGNVGCGRLQNGLIRLRAALSSNVGSQDCTNLQSAYEAVDQVLASGPVNPNVTYNWGLIAGPGGPGLAYLKGKRFIRRVDSTLFFGLQ